ncbi:carboxy methyl transferase for protein phosphatase 2A [Orbilia oligospora]|uniref:Leucine carboxyl methyltransferase 1 n=1 Tax=Orbilia oligospora TaxID=2813651 RepID=A0A7C8RE69_ORBOL|nr:carboxy methyl transferase for protein phosphatase 2A [Orbilia oligospora]
MAIPTRFATPSMAAPPSSAEKDRTVQQTDMDALVSRCSAVQTGYLTDPYVEMFLDISTPRDRRYPLINRGTYIRTKAIDQIVESFLSRPFQGKKQIISLGAGSDTRFFRLATNKSLQLLYHEFDFPQVTSRKITAIQRHKELATIISEFGQVNPPEDGSGVPGFRVDARAGSLSSLCYYIHPIDLRTLKPGVPLPAGIDATLPTLFISECCLIYLSPNEADDIFRWITSSFGQASESNSNGVGIVLYEPIGGDDSFGKVMIRNLSQRGIVLRTLQRYSTLERQKERMRVLGFNTGMGACDVNFIHNEWIDSKEKERIDGLELLDEREEWVLLAKHYCIAWGWIEQHAASGSAADLSFQSWSQFPIQRS